MTDPKTHDGGVASGLDETMIAPSAGTAPVPSASPSAPGTMGAELIAGRYELLGLLGSGGMGAVYRARDVELDETVALKVLRRELCEAPGMLARFRQEAKLARRVTHRNVARTFDIGEHAGEKFLTMELVEGESLASVVDRRGRLPITEVLHIVQEICAGMSAAHAASVVHRDLKPDNVMVGKDGRIVVTDFGIAHAAAGAVGVAKTLGGIVGTPAYMAPEQIEGGADLDARADIYALGAMTYELLTGERAWPGDAPFVVAAARLVNPPPDPRAIVPGLPAPVASVVMTCMAKGPADRYSTAAEVADALASAVSTAATGSLPGPPSVDAEVPAALGVSPGATDKTVAVLPFTNGGPPEDEYLAAGITEDLIDVLSMSRGLRVRPLGAVAHLRGAHADARHVGAELGVQVVVDGSVRRTADRIRVTARLVSASDGFQLWAKRFDRPAADALAVNDEAGSAIAEALTVSGPSIPRVSIGDPFAVDLYLRASHEFHKFWREDVLRAVALYDQALERAPNDPTILAASARARVRLAFFGGPGAADALERATAAAERAVSGAPELGESWAALAAARFMCGGAPGAARAALKALSKTPGIASAHDVLGRILAECGRPDDAITHLRAALDIDPSVLSTRMDLVRVYALMGRWPEADTLMALPAPGPGGRVTRFLHLARLSLWRGEMHPDLDDPPVLSPEMGVIVDTKGFVEVLRTRELTDAYRAGMETAARLGAKGSRRRAFYSQINAEIYGSVFEVDQSLVAIGEAIEAGLADIVWMDRCPVLEAARGDARFAPLRDEVLQRAQRAVVALTDWM